MSGARTPLGLCCRTLAVVAALAAAEARADYDTGVAAYAAGDYAAAVAEWRPSAEDGDAASQYGMGLIYESGRGVGRDYTQAARWYRMSAEQGHPGAQFNLGHLHRLGSGVPPDMSQAVHWWRMAADQGLSQAQLALGVAYQRGEGVAADPEQAVMWFERAVASGNAAAEYAMGLAYENGSGVARDIDLAIAHYERAAAGGIEPALTRLGALTFPPTEEEPPLPPAEGEVVAPGEEIALNGAAVTETAEQDEPVDAAGTGASFEAGEPRYIQIAAYVDHDRAKRAWGQLVSRHGDLLGGLPHRVLEVDLGGNTGVVYRLQAGPMPNAGEAESICNLLKAQNTDCFLVKP